MFRLNREHGTTLLLVTHDAALAGRCARRLSLAAGRLVGDDRRRARRNAPDEYAAARLRMLSRDWRAGELTMLIAAMVLAVASIGTVGFFADRVKGALAQAGEPAARRGRADLRRSAAAGIASPRRRASAASSSTPVLRFNSMVRREDADASAGRRRAHRRQGGGAALSVARHDHARRCRRTRAERRRRGIPPRGEAWPDARLAARLGIKVGDTLAVGDATLKVGAIVQQEPEVASGLLAIGPRLLINLDDVPATNLLQPGNRATYRLLVADLSTRDALDPYLKWLQAELKPGQRMENVRDLRPEVRQTLERAEQFLGLSALVAVILAAVAVALAASRYLRRHLDTAAMLRCFGASRRQALALFVLQFAALGVLASVAGIALALARAEPARRAC